MPREAPVMRTVAMVVEPAIRAGGRVHPLGGWERGAVRGTLLGMFITKALAASALGLLVAAPSSFALTPLQPKFVPAPGTMSVNRYGPAAASTQGRALIMGGAINQGLGQGAQTKLVDTFAGAAGFSLLSGQANSV